MATLRVGLKQLPNDSNSPSIALIQSKKGKSEAKKKLIIKATDVCDKENSQTQAATEFESSYAQTDVVAVKENAAVAEEDLLCEEPTSSYWRGMVERFEQEIDKELETSFTMSLELDKSYEELEDSKNRLKVLMDVLDDILSEADEQEVANSSSDEGDKK